MNSDIVQPKIRTNEKKDKTGTRYMGTRLAQRPTLTYTYNNMYIVINIIEKAHVSVKIVTLSASVEVSGTILCSSKRFLYICSYNREQREAILFYYNRLNVKANVH